MGRGNFCVKIACDLTRRNVFPPPEEYSSLRGPREFFFFPCRVIMSRAMLLSRPFQFVPAAPAGSHLYIRPRTYAHTQRLDIYYIQDIFFKFKIFFFTDYYDKQRAGIEPIPFRATCHFMLFPKVVFAMMANKGQSTRTGWCDRCMYFTITSDPKQLTVSYKPSVIYTVGAPSQLRTCDIRLFRLIRKTALGETMNGKEREK